MRRQSFSRAELFPMRYPGILEYLVMHNHLLAIATRHKAGGSLNECARRQSLYSQHSGCAEGMSLNRLLRHRISWSVVSLYQRVADS